MATTPILLLDLDGVLNPFAAAACPDGYQECVLFEGEDPQRYRRGHGEWIRELSTVAEVWWATGWGDHANELFLPLLGVDPLPVVRFPPVPFDPELKVPAVAEVAGDRPAAWIDDNRTRAACWAAAAPHRRCWSRSTRRSAGPGPTSTASSTGPPASAPVRPDLVFMDRHPDAFGTGGAADRGEGGGTGRLVHLLEHQMARWARRTAVAEPGATPRGGDMRHTVHTPDGRLLTVVEGGDPTGRPVLAHHGTPNCGESVLYGPWARDAAGAGCG